MSNVDIAHEWAADDSASPAPRPSAQRTSTSRRARGLASVAVACLMAGSVAYGVGAFFKGHSEPTAITTREQHFEPSRHLVPRTHVDQSKPSVTMGDGDGDGGHFEDNDSDSDA